jgi:hypothetical protein
MADKVEDKMKTLVDIKFVFDNFVQKYKEFCIDKIWIPESKNVNIDNFVNDSEIPVDSSDNCLDGLNDVGAIIDRLFDSEKNFITQMEADIKNFNKLYNCFQFGNLEDPGHPLQEAKEHGGGGK